MSLRARTVQLKPGPLLAHHGHVLGDTLVQLLPRRPRALASPPPEADCCR